MFENIQPTYMSTLIHFSPNAHFPEHVKHLTTGVCITEDPKMLSLHFFKKCIENISENLLVYF